MEDGVFRYISLFSGVEAATVAWHPLGWEPVAFAEFDKFPSAVLAHHYPHVPNVGDVTKHDWKQYEGKIDLVVGGSPCQSFSVAGKRLGMDDPRGNLALEYLRVVRDVKPRWFLYENVPGLLSSAGGRDFGTFLREVEELGYGWSYRVLDARYFGVPQRRRRVFVVGCAGGDRDRAGSVLLEPESLFGNPGSSGSTGQDASEGSGSGSEGPSGSEAGRPDPTEEAVTRALWAIFDQRLDTAPNGSPVIRTESPTIRASDHKGPHVVYSMTPTSSGRNWRTETTEVTQTITTEPAPTGNQGGDVVMEVKPQGVDLFNQTLTGDVHVPLRTAGGHGAPAVAEPYTYDLFNITAPVNRQNRKPGDPCHTLARTNAEHAAVMEDTSPIAFHATQDPISNTDHFPAMGTGSTSGAGSLGVAEGVRYGIPGNWIGRKPENGGNATTPMRETSPCLTGTDRHAVGPVDDVVAPTLTAANNPSRSPQSAEVTAQIDAVHQATMTVRKLTPRECERLQGFPDDYTRIPWRGKPADQCPDGHRYKAMGNSMAVPVMAWIGRRIDIMNRME